MKNILLLFLLAFLVQSCGNNTESSIADTIIINGTIATMNPQQADAEAIAIKDDRILFVGTKAEVEAYQNETTKVIDAKGQFVMPGFIEGHGHFHGLGKSLIKLNLLHTKNWNEIVSMVEETAKNTKKGVWIEGRGWHQEKWDEKLDKQVQGYPYHDKLSEISKDNPVILRHASGHSVFVNAKAMELLGVGKESPDVKGGLIIRDPQGNPIGVFEERAMDIFVNAYDAYFASLSKEEQMEEWNKAMQFAQKECLQKGITSFQDAGATFEHMDNYIAMAKNNELQLRLWVMLREPYDSMKNRMDGFPMYNVGGKNFFTSAAIKTQVDGALGARGAWLLAPYNDKADFLGQNTTTVEEVQNSANLAAKHGMQLCVHAIGDRANREVLNVFENTFKQHKKKDLRWRIEHAQHVNTTDIPRFKELDVIASMQGIHCTSDAPFVEKRLGEQRAKEEAYPWRSFLDIGVKIANGTDAPVEDVDPIHSFYASVTRKRADGTMTFYPEQRMTRQEALASYTINNAFAAFEEKEKGSLEVGKLADIVILSKNLLTVADKEILDTKVLFTIVGGKIAYQQ